VNVNEVIAEVVGLAEADLARNRVALRMQLATDLPKISGDRVQLQQVILNLIANAIDSMNNLVDRAKELVISSFIGDERSIKIGVRDSGTGLSAEASNRLFEPFFTTKKEGLGLGLSITRTIVEGHGGRLHATTNTDHGATFEFSLPRVAGAVA
jgi:C4-dicarboxylate-specific signal transduction histidine kinase